MVTPRELQWVKSNWASRPGGCSWGKYTSRSGPCSASSTGGVEYGGPDSSAGPPLWARTGPFPGFYGDVAPPFYRFDTEMAENGHSGRLWQERAWRPSPGPRSPPEVTPGPELLSQGMTPPAAAGVETRGTGQSPPIQPDRPPRLQPRTMADRGAF